MPKRFYVTISIIIIAIGLFCGLAIPAMWSSDVQYSGNSHFNSEQEYSTFKQALIDSHATWQSDKMQALSSEPPIIVNYTISVPRNTTFPYGHKDLDFRFIMPAFSAVFASILVTFNLLMTPYGRTFWWKKESSS